MSAQPATPDAGDAAAAAHEVVATGADEVVASGPQGLWDALQEPWSTVAGGFHLDVGVAPWSVRLLVALAGLALLARGASFGRDAPRLASAISGTLLAAGVLAAFGPPERYAVPTAAAGVLALGAAGVLWAERLNLRLGLAFVGVLVGLALSLAGLTAFGSVTPPWVPWAVAGVLAVVLPWVFESMPRLTTPTVGALAVCWSLGMATSLPLLVGLAALGLLLQVYTGAAASLDIDPRAA
ncbi:MAG: hypothetical protein H6732_00765 [Alphaproteobacteria bacterium]|nr:hypothetical protein [Alphaproteobacteria bacterium]